MHEVQSIRKGRKERMIQLMVVPVPLCVLLSRVNEHNNTASERLQIYGALSHIK